MSHVDTVTEEPEMRIPCPHCGKPLRVTNSNQISTTVRDSYADCVNPDCDCRVVMGVFHKHDIRPPKSKMDELIAETLRKMPPEQLKSLLVNA